MTTNNPKPAVHRYKERPDDMCSAWLYTRRADHVPPGHHGEALIRLSDYENLQAELANMERDYLTIIEAQDAEHRKQLARLQAECAQLRAAMQEVKP